MLELVVGIVIGLAIGWTVFRKFSWIGNEFCVVGADAWSLLGSIWTKLTDRG